MAKLPLRKWGALTNFAVWKMQQDRKARMSSGSAPTPVAPSFTLQPLPQAVDEFVAANFVVAANDYDTLQWYKNGLVVSGATGLTYSFIATASDNAASVYCIATKGALSAQSEPASITVRGAAYFNEINYSSDYWTLGTIAPDGSKVQYGLIAGDYSAKVEPNEDYYVKVEWAGVTGKFVVKVADTTVTAPNAMVNGTGYTERVIKGGAGSVLYIQDAVGGTSGGTIKVTCKKLTYPASFKAPMIYNDYASLNTRFETSYASVKPYMTTTNANDNDEYAWHCVYWLQFYIEMHRLSGDVKWYTYMTDLITRMFNYTDEQRQLRGEIDTAVQTYAEAPTAYRFTNVGVAAPSWRRLQGNRQVIPLITGQICRGIMRCIDYIKIKNNHPVTVALATAYLPKIKIALDIHDDTWVYDRPGNGTIPGSFHYQNPNVPNGTYSNPVANNHNFVWSIASLLYNKWATPVTEYQNRAVAIMAFIRLYWIPKPQHNALVWRYALDVTNPNSKIEDANHGHLDMSFFNPVYKRSLINMTDDEYTRIANNIVYRYAGNQDMAEKIDGTEGVAIAAHQIEVPLDFVDVADKRYDAVRIARGVLNKWLVTEPTFAVPYASLATMIRVESIGAV